MWRKLCLLAAFLRANQISSAISYQLLTRADDVNESYMIHALNILHIKVLNILYSIRATEIYMIYGLYLIYMNLIFNFSYFKLLYVIN